MSVLEAIIERRSVRRYEKKQIPDEFLFKLLTSARWAPSWANTQCWEFVIVKDNNTKTLLQETLSKWNPARKAIMEAPVIIVACGKKGLSGYIKGKEVTNKGDWYMFDVAIAIEHIILTAYELGLGTVHIGAFNSEEVKKILKIPEDVEVVELIPIGYPAETPKPPKRKEIREFVYYEKYGIKKK
jgi:nitroreductase